MFESRGLMLEYLVDKHCFTRTIEAFWTLNENDDWK